LLYKGIGMQRSSFASSKSLNPLKRVNSILTGIELPPKKEGVLYVSIPSSGSIQFLLTDREDSKTETYSRVSIPSSGSIQFLRLFRASLPNLASASLNPLKRVNSILTVTIADKLWQLIGLNPLKRVNSILTSLCQILLSMR